MCFQRKKVDVDLQFANDFAVSSVEIGCGKCADCRWRKYNDYLVRCYFEFEKVSQLRSQGAFALFETLTYREDKLPTFEGIPCFSSRDINLFIKRLKEYWRDKLGHPLAFSYIIVSEHGGKRGRPHYHPIFFVFEQIDFVEFLQSIYDCWNNGKTDYIDTLGRKYLLRAKSHVLTSCAAIRYILKYLFKYADFDLVFDDVLKRLADRYDVEKAASERDFFMYHCRPFIRTSVGFGLPSSVDELSSDGRVRVPNGRGFDDLPAARYIIRKLCHEKVAVLDENGCPILRPNGNPVWLKTANGSYVYQKSAFGVQYSMQNLSRLIGKTAVTYKQIIDTFPDFIKRTLYSMLHGRKLHDLAVYNIVYSGCVSDKFYLHFCESVFDPQTYQDFYFKRLSRNPQAKLESDNIKNYCVVTESSCLEFEDFDYILNIIRCQANVLDQRNSDKPQKIDSYIRLSDAIGSV